MKEINWAMVLSFLVPGAGQIGRMRLSAGYFWFIVFYVSIGLGIYYSYFWFVISFLIHILNVLDAGELLGQMVEEKRNEIKRDNKSHKSLNNTKNKQSRI